MSIYCVLDRLVLSVLLSMSSDAPASVRLPRATANGTLTKNKPPVWAIDTSGPSVQTPLPAKCSRHNREGEVCCQELKGDDERQLIDPDVVRDVCVPLLFFFGDTTTVGASWQLFLSLMPRRRFPCHPIHQEIGADLSLVSGLLLTALSVSRSALPCPSRSPRACRPSASPSSSSSAESPSSSPARYPWASGASSRRKRNATTTASSAARPRRAYSARATARCRARSRIACSRSSLPSSAAAVCSTRSVGCGGASPSVSPSSYSNLARASVRHRSKK